MEGDRSEAATLAINREGDERNVRLSFTEGTKGARTQDAVLSTSSEEGNPPTEEEIIRIDKFFEPSHYELLALARLRQLRGDTVDVSRLLDSSKPHAALGRYWGRRDTFSTANPSTAGWPVASSPTAS